MAKEYFQNWSESPERVSIRGSFATDDAGTGYPITKTPTGRGFTVSQTAAGTYAIVFDNSYDRLEYATAHLRRPSVDSARAVVGTWTSATRTLVVWTVAEDGTPAAADPTDDANSILNFEAVFNVTESLR